MTLEDQVCSLELAKKLKELGVKQESVFYWKPIHNRKGLVGFKLHAAVGLRRAEDIICKTLGAGISAFTVAELGEMLPKKLVGDHPLWYLTIHCNDNYYNVSYETFDGKIEKDFEARDKNEANARAKMLIYLIENKLITL